MKAVINRCCAKHVLFSMHKYLIILIFITSCKIEVTTRTISTDAKSGTATSTESTTSTGTESKKDEPSSSSLDISSPTANQVFLLGEAAGARQLTLSGSCPVGAVSIAAGSGSSVISATCTGGVLEAVVEYGAGLSGNRTITVSVGESTHQVVIELKSCPNGYVKVPGYAAAPLSTSDFCLAKYEMRDVSGVATSTATGAPHANQSRDSAKTMCDDLNGSTSYYSLASAAQWQTAARNASLQGENWTGASPGSGQLIRGHSDNVPGFACDSVHEYVGAGGSAGSCVAEGTPTLAQRRTFYLDNGEQVWDLAGNFNEVVDYPIFTHRGVPGKTGWPGALVDVNSDILYTSLSDDVNISATGMNIRRGLFAPPDATWTHASHKIGGIALGNCASAPCGDHTDNAIARGDNYGANAGWSGLFAAWLQAATASTNGYFSYRCVYQP